MDNTIRLSRKTCLIVESIVNFYRDFGDNTPTRKHTFYGMDLIIDETMPDENFKEFELRARKRFSEYTKELRRKRLGES